MRQPVLLCTILLAMTLQHPIRGAGEDTPPLVDTELVTLALGDPVSGLFWFDGGKVQPFRSVPRGMGIPAHYQGPAELVLQSDPGAFHPDAPPTSPAARILLPRDADRVLILTGEGRDKAIPYKAVPIDSSRIRAGDYLVFNLSSHRVALKLGTQHLQLVPGTSGKLSDPQWRQDVLDLPVYMGFLLEGEMKTFTSVWGHRPARRNFLFVVDSDSSGGPPRLRRTYDLPPARHARAE